MPPTGLPLLRLLSAFALMGLGLGVASVASTAVGTAGVTPADRGVSGGVLNSAAQLGTALGLAVLIPLATRAGGAGDGSTTGCGWAGSGRPRSRSSGSARQSSCRGASRRRPTNPPAGTPMSSASASGQKT